MTPPWPYKIITDGVEISQNDIITFKPITSFLFIGLFTTVLYETIDYTNYSIFRFTTYNIINLILSVRRKAGGKHVPYLCFVLIWSCAFYFAIEIVINKMRTNHINLRISDFLLILPSSIQIHVFNYVSPDLTIKALELSIHTRFESA